MSFIKENLNSNILINKDKKNIISRGFNKYNQIFRKL